jgi:enoyl-CoA hydratase/carnithine racemase
VTYETLSYDVEADGILILRLNRPDKMNAFTVTMAHELDAAFNRASGDDAVRAVVVTGAGKAYCAGMDLSVGGNVFGLDESQRPTPKDVAERWDDSAIQAGVRDTGGRVTLAIMNCTKPVIGAINGAAVGIGATMILAMDFRFASEKARFGFVFGRIGITPEGCSSFFLPRVVGMSQALEWLYRAEIFDAQEALDKGLVRSVHPPEELLDAARAFARSLITDRSPVSVAMIRQLLMRAQTATPLEAHKAESLAMFYSSIGEGKEGIRAFLEKRPPQFSGRATDLPPVFPEGW